MKKKTLDQQIVQKFGTLRAFAEEIGVTRQHLRFLRIGERGPSVKSLQAIAKALNISEQEALKIIGE